MFVYLKYVHGVSLNKVIQYTQIFADVQKLLMLLNILLTCWFCYVKVKVNADKIIMRTLNCCSGRELLQP